MSRCSTENSEVYVSFTKQHGIIMTLYFTTHCTVKYTLAMHSPISKAHIVIVLVIVSPILGHVYDNYSVTSTNISVLYHNAHNRHYDQRRDGHNHSCSNKKYF